MTRMSPVGSLACVSCLKFNLHSVDSSHYFPLVSGSTTNLVFLKTQTADFLKNTNIPNDTNEPCGLFSLRFLLEV